jgi:hypothetical protein
MKRALYALCWVWLGLVALGALLWIVPDWLGMWSGSSVTVLTGAAVWNIARSDLRG